MGGGVVHPLGRRPDVDVQVSLEDELAGAPVEGEAAPLPVQVLRGVVGILREKRRLGGGVRAPRLPPLPCPPGRCLTSVATWWRLACSMSMCQSPCSRRRLLSHQGRGGLGSSEGLVSRSMACPIRVQAGSQQGPHTMVNW